MSCDNWSGQPTWRLVQDVCWHDISTQRKRTMPVPLDGTWSQRSEAWHQISNLVFLAFPFDVSREGKTMYTIILSEKFCVKMCDIAHASDIEQKVLHSKMFHSFQKWWGPITMKKYIKYTAFSKDAEICYRDDAQHSWIVFKKLVQKRNIHVCRRHMRKLKRAYIFWVSGYFLKSALKHTCIIQVR